MLDHIGDRSSGSRPPDLFVIVQRPNPVLAYSVRHPTGCQRWNLHAGQKIADGRGMGAAGSPRCLVPALDLVDEVWVPSKFVADCFIDVTRKPVRVIPHAIPPNELERREARATLHLPHDAYIFLTILDTGSFPTRKNLAGTIAAFKAAFPTPGPSQPMLVVKIRGKANRTPPLQRLLEDSRLSSAIRIIDTTLSEEEMRRLQAALLLCVVASLGRIWIEHC